MDELENKDDVFIDLMAKSKLDMPFSDFEDSVMQQIEENVIQKSEISKQLRLSKFFFILGSLFGIIISILLSQIQEPIFNISPNVIALVFQITFATLFFTQIENYIKIKRS